MEELLLEEELLEDELLDEELLAEELQAQQGTCNCEHVQKGKSPNLFDCRPMQEV